MPNMANGKAQLNRNIDFNVMQMLRDLADARTEGNATKYLEQMIRKDYNRLAPDQRKRVKLQEAA